MSMTAEATHPIVDAVSVASRLLAGVGESNPTFMQPHEQAAALTSLIALEGQAAELRARITTAANLAGGLAEAAGTKSAGVWLVNETRTSPPAARAAEAFAQALERRPIVARALRDGRANLEQAEAILRAVDALPPDLPAGTVVLAEQTLVDEAAAHGPKSLRFLGRRILQVIDPDLADAEEAARLADEERSAYEKARLSMRPQGDGTTKIHATVPDLVATVLANILHAYTSPRRSTVPSWAPDITDPSISRGIDPGDETVWWKLPHARKLGHAFGEFLEHLDHSRLPDHGSSSTEVVVTISYADLLAELGVARVIGVNGEEMLTASEVRRLACNATIIPAVLDGKGHVLDLGRGKRLATKAQKRALMLRHATCRTVGCDMPAAMCDVHHLDPWSAGGRTDLADLALLCSQDHHRIHDTAYLHERLPDGTIRFSRRT